MSVTVLRTHLLSAFPGLSCCPLCVAYTSAHLASHSGIDVLSAALAHHDSAHMNDPLA
jgi:hypothetical protein